MIKELLKEGIVLLGELIESWGTGVSREELVLRESQAQARIAELEHDVEAARSDSGRIQLTKDMRNALGIATYHSQPYSQSEDTDLWVRQQLRKLLDSAHTVEGEDFDLQAGGLGMTDEQVYRTYPTAREVADGLTCGACRRAPDPRGPSACSDCRKMRQSASAEDYSGYVWPGLAPDSPRQCSGCDRPYEKCACIPF